MNGQALHDLAQYHGSETRYRHHPNLIYTEGVRHLITSACAFWLLDIISSYQPTAAKDSMLQQMQFWRLLPNEWQGDRASLLSYFAPEETDGKFQAHVIAERDTDNPAIVQQIPFTDFPFADLPEVKIYLLPEWDYERKTSVWLALLPSEY